MNQHEIKEKIFSEIAKVPDFPELGPKVVSIGPVPVRPNTRRLFSYPEIVRLFVEYLKPAVMESKADIIVGAATAGLPLAMALSLATDVPFTYVRKEEKTHGVSSHGNFEGDCKKGDRAVLVDDAMGRGETKVAFFNILKELGITVTDIITVLSTKNKPVKEFEEMVAENNIKIHYVYEWSELTEAQIKYGKIPKELAPMVLDYVNDPDSWNDNREKWHQYCLALNEINIEIPEFLKQYE